MKPVHLRRMAAHVTMLGAALLLLSGCAGKPFASSSPEEQVTQRSTAYWQAVRAQQWDRAYRYTTPAYREMFDREAFRRNVSGDLGWHAVELVQVECDPQPTEYCTATIRLQVPPTRVRGLELDNHRREIWHKVDGRWYVIPRQR